VVSDEELRTQSWTNLLDLQGCGGPVSTWMGDHQQVGKPSRYVMSHPFLCVEGKCILAKAEVLTGTPCNALAYSHGLAM